MLTAPGDLFTIGRITADFVKPANHGMQESENSELQIATVGIVASYDSDNQWPTVIVLPGTDLGPLHAGC
ncbi:MAG: hypothetical protein ACOY32_09670 [Thermodesulfobacteriota bacterium]